MRALVFFLSLAMLSPSANAAPETVAVREAIDATSFVTLSGDTVRLAGIAALETSRGGIPAEPIAGQAKEALAALVQSKSVRVDAAGERDRHNWLIGEVYTADGIWVQGRLLEEGLAMVSGFSGVDASTAQKMLALENVAIAAKRGIWATPAFRVIAPGEAKDYVSRYKLVEGRVTSAHLYHGNLYINFSRRWKGEFAVFVSHKALPAFSLPALLGLPGKTIRVRGWIDYRSAPSIDVTEPMQMEIL